MRESRRNLVIRFAGSIILCGLAVARTVGADWQGNMDSLFFVVVGTALVLAIIPLSRLSQFKAGSLEVVLNRPEVAGAIGGLNLQTVQNEELRRVLQRSETEIPTIRGSRVLWVDDRPEKIVALRRLLRALGVDVVSTVSSSDAKDALAKDSDYDLLITDVQRHGDSHESTGGIEIHEGTNFIVWLRNAHPDPVVQSIPVVFYAAYDWERLVKFTRPARETSPEPAIANSVSDFMSKVINALIAARTAPIIASGAKEATYARTDT